MATEKGSRPILNPVLALKREARPTATTARSPGESAVRVERLTQQRIKLSSQLRNLSEVQRTTHAGAVQFRVAMFSDSLAPTWTPDGLFGRRHGAKLVAPARDGFLVEAASSALPDLAQLIETSEVLDVRIAISRVSDLFAIDGPEVFRQRTAEVLWARALEGDRGRQFTVWLAPFSESKSRDSVVLTLQDLARKGVFSPCQNLVSIAREVGADDDQLHVQSSPNDSSLARASREYREKQFTRLTVELTNLDKLGLLVASGAVYRIDPVAPLVAATVPTAPDPDRPVPDEQWHPIVGIVDGGLHASSYLPMEAWRAPSLVGDVAANRAHGNRITSLLVHGYDWNQHLHLPQLVCRVGTAQAIAKDGEGRHSRAQFVSYLREVIQKHSNECRVWNMSFNEVTFGDDPLEMSELGHEIRKIAREFNVLPVISIGNVSPENNQRLCAPADCEAALSVGGCTDKAGAPDLHCVACVPGPGPEGLHKPEVSWFSTLRGLGGGVATGSSYATAVTSALAAHTFHNLKAPTPDLVKALLLNSTGREGYNGGLGWGTPYDHPHLPWVCPEGSVTLVWTAKLKPGVGYYWEDIPIPPELVINNKLFGKGVLTAVLNPLVSELGSANYFATRLQVALQYDGARGTTQNLLGTMREDRVRELDARTEHAKWNPVRHHTQDFSRYGRSFSGKFLRLHARVFARDLYQFGFSSNSEVEPLEVAFALTLTAKRGVGSEGMYNSMATSLGTYVESAVLDQDINV